ncbi:MAG: YgjV family protein [Ruminiclostridium sp.]|nr:YgjV family protein [Ruminiclostridium sp.]
MNSFSLILGNACSILAMITDSISANQKTPKAVLLVQSLSQLIYCIGTLVLRGYSGAVQNAVSILRNFVAIRNIQSKALEWTLVALGVILGLAFNNLGLMGLLPVLANFQYTLAIFRFKDNERALKFSFLLSVGMFALFNIAIYNLVGVISNSVVCISTAVNLWKSRKQ